MKNCRHCGTEVNDSAVFCEKCGYSLSENNPKIINPNDAPSGRLAVLSFFFPLIGLICIGLAYFLNHVPFIGNLPEESFLKAKKAHRMLLVIAGIFIVLSVFFIGNLKLL